MKHQLYCLDANVLIVAWQTYYSPDICPSYWDFINKLGEEERIFLPMEVFNELKNTEDELLKWVKKSKIPIMRTNTAVAQCLREIYNANPLHRLLSDASKNRSMADPWVIAHAMSSSACVVTKENKIDSSPKKIKIPNVCENMDVPWINDFEFGRHFSIRFTCSI